MNKANYDDKMTMMSCSTTSVVRMKECSKVLKKIISPVLCKKKKKEKVMNHHEEVHSIDILIPYPRKRP